MRRPSNLPPGWQPPSGPPPRRHTLREKRNEVARRDDRYARWHVPAASEREPDSWLLSYLDLVSLLLIVFAVLLAMTKMDVNARPAAAETVDTPVVVVAAAAAAAQDEESARSDNDAAQVAVGAGTDTDASADADVDADADADADAEDPAPVLAMPALDDDADTGTPSIATAPDNSEDAPLPVVLVSPLRLEGWNPMPDLDLSAHASPTLAPEPTLPTPAELGLNELGDDIDVIVNEKSISFRISSEILFDSGQADLMPSGVAVLERLVEVLRRNDNLISVEGHSDPVPIQNNRFPSNWELSAGRAASVLRLLERSGIVPARLRATGYAHTRPIAPNDTATGRATNRRVELIMETQRAQG